MLKQDNGQIPLINISASKSHKTYGYKINIGYWKLTTKQTDHKQFNIC